MVQKAAKLKNALVAALILLLLSGVFAMRGYPAGVCDIFDGKIASTKTERTRRE